MNSFSINGLDTKEFETYKHLLSLKRATVLELSKVSGEKRPNLYRILNGLIDKRLVSEVYEGKKHYYIAESPKTLLSFLNQEKAKLQQVLPELENLEKEALERPKIKFYEGKEGIKTLYDEILKERQEILAFAWPEKLMDKIEFHTNFSEHRVKLGIPNRTIYPDTKLAHRRKTGLKEAKFAKNLQSFDATLLIAGDKVVLFSHTRWITGVLIENKEIAQCMKAFFNGYWQELK